MMRSAIRSVGLVGLVIAAVVALAWTSPLTAVVQLLGTTAFIMGGTQHPLVSETSDTLAEDPVFVGSYVNGALDRYIIPTAEWRGDDYAGTEPDPGDYNRVPVYTPEEFWPTYGTRTFDDSVAVGLANLDRCVTGVSCRAFIYPSGPGATDTYVVFAYSQSARIVTIEKRRLADPGYLPPPGGIKPGTADLSFLAIGNPNRANGGVLMRFNGLYIPILDVSFDGATPTDTGYLTDDVSRQYDGWSDFPLYPLNLLATTNAIAGIAYLHGDYFLSAVPDMQYQGSEGDTDYYLVATKHLPVLMPLEQLGVPSPIITALDAPMRVIVEWGYDRDESLVGTPMTAKLIRLENPVTDLVNLAVAIPTGWDDGISEALGDPDIRPFQTQKVTSPYGVGGAELPEAPDDSLAKTAELRVTTDNLDDDRGQPEDTKLDADADDTKLDADADADAQRVTGTTVDAPSVPKNLKGKKSPLRQLVRDPVEVRAERPKAFRPNTDRPLRRVLKTLSEQRDKPAKGSAKESEDDAKPAA